MPAVNLYFQLHQPYRLRRYSVFDADARYFDDEHNPQILRKVASKCYLPATRIILDQIHRHAGDFRVAFSLTGTVIEQFKAYAPEVIDLFRKLSQTGCVEFLSETYHHSLASLYNPDEFRLQVDQHAEVIDELFGQSPVVFRNTELIYNNSLAQTLVALGRFRGVLTEGADQILAGRSANKLYQAPNGLPILLKNYTLSDDIAFRFVDPKGTGEPLSAEEFAQTIAKLDEDPDAQVCNLFMDYETFGEHQWKETGILDFLAELPSELLKRDQRFLTPRETLDEIDPVDRFDAPQAVSWADSERDLSAWIGNAMQSSALNELYRLADAVKAANDPQLMRDWRRLTTSDHFYYMCTKYFADGDVHKYFSPYESPYDSYINFMNVLDNLRARTEASETTIAE